MSEVIHRTVFAERVKTPTSPEGVVRFLDWAIVTLNNNESGLSTMVEPFMVNHRYLTGVGLGEYDPTDPAVRIDYIQFIDENKLPIYLSGNTDQPRLHGGTLTPTAGKGDLVY